MGKHCKHYDFSLEPVIEIKVEMPWINIQACTDEAPPLQGMWDLIVESIALYRLHLKL
jgi:hypothetical protein